MGVGNQATHHIHHEIQWTTIPGMLNLRDVLQLVNNRFHNGSLALQQFVGHVHQPIFHAPLQFGHQVNALLPKLLKEFL